MSSARSADPVIAPGRARAAAWLRSTRRFLSGSWLNALGAGLLVLVLGFGLFGPRLAPYAPNHLDLTAVLHPPSGAHWFGTDNLGRDIFSRVLAGARISLEVAVVILSLSVTVGTMLGVVSGLIGGLVDEVVQRITDLFLAFPAFILAAAIAATLGPNLNHTVLALAVVFWPWYTRLARGQVLSLREREFVLAARVSGAGIWWIAVRHLLRNVLPIIVVQISLDVGYAILATSSLSFLGLGAQPPTPEWGALITEGRSFIQTAWWWPTFPGLALAVTVIAFNLLGDGLRDAIDPRLRGSLRGIS